jgi:hypothetical protein
MRLFCDAIEVSGGLGGRVAALAESRLAEEAGRRRRASARQSVGQQVDDTGEGAVQCSDGDGEVTQQREPVKEQVESRMRVRWSSNSSRGRKGRKAASYRRRPKVLF